jgi:hypothetical protein
MSREVNEMKIKKTIAASAATLALSGAVLGGVAMASSGGSYAKPDNATTAVSGGAGASAESPATDTDNVQEGDQTGAEKSDANEAPGAESAESDGPGGHEDPPGNVDHQFDGEE